jgi:beta-N-acetylhexosaminidase
MTETRAAIVGISGPVLMPAEQALFRAHPPAGVILFARNIASPDQLRDLTSALRDALPAGAVIMVDQEGGRVARLRPPQWRGHPSAGRIGALWQDNPEAATRAAWLTGALIGLDAAAMGFEIVCAPVLDLRLPGASDVVGDRSFGADPAIVAALGGAMADGLLAAGLQPVMKHAPGHGRALVDSHLALPEVDALLDDDIAPFRALASLPWAMTAHVRYADRDAMHPATLSASVIADVIRGAIGFTGVLCSDDLAMSALQGDPPQRALACLAAGCDIALYCPGDGPGTAAVLRACPTLTDAAQTRLAAARALAQRRAIALDATTLSAERDALLPWKT